MTTPNRLRHHLIMAGLAFFILISALLYLKGGRYVSTDDAYTEAPRVEISASIPGRVTHIDVRDNQAVKRGDRLFELDEREFRIKLEEARANLADAKMRVAALQATYLQKQAELKSAEETVSYMDREYQRQKKLASHDIASKAELDKALHELAGARQKALSVRQEKMNLLALLGGNPNIGVERHPEVLRASADLDRAKLNYSYTIVRAPIEGIVAKVEGLQVGDYIRAATPVFPLIAEKHAWVEANFKESELAHMRVGQAATIKIDAFPGRTFHGVVESLSPGTGSSFSLLPPENATGNWVKIVQRLPVRISITDAEKAMHSGLSATVEVDTRYSRMPW